jgi:hypothetical protein
LSVHVENVTGIEHRIEEPEGFTATDVSVNNRTWDNFDLDRGGSKTIVVYFSNGMPTKADMVIAVDYRFLWHTWRWFFRFEGIHMDNWRWSKQPIGDLEPAINKAVDDSLAKHRELIQRQP